MKTSKLSCPGCKSDSDFDRNSLSGHSNEHCQRNITNNNAKRVTQPNPSRHQICQRDSTDWTLATKNYPCRYQVLAKKSKEEQRIVKRRLPDGQHLQRNASRFQSPNRNSKTAAKFRSSSPSRRPNTQPLHSQKANSSKCTEKFTKRNLRQPIKTKKTSSERCPSQPRPTERSQPLENSNLKHERNCGKSFDGSSKSCSRYILGQNVSMENSYAQYNDNCNQPIYDKNEASASHHGNGYYTNGSNSSRSLYFEEKGGIDRCNEENPGVICCRDNYYQGSYDDEKRIPLVKSHCNAQGTSKYCNDDHYDRDCKNLHMYRKRDYGEQSDTNEYTKQNTGRKDDLYQRYYDDENTHVPRTCSQDENKRHECGEKNILRTYYSNEHYQKNYVEPNFVSRDNDRVTGRLSCIQTGHNPVGFDSSDINKSDPCSCSSRNKNAVEEKHNRTSHFVSKMAPPDVHDAAFKARPPPGSMCSLRPDSDRYLKCAPRRGAYPEDYNKSCGSRDLHSKAQCSKNICNSPNTLRCREQSQYYQNVNHSPRENKCSAKENYTSPQREKFQHGSNVMNNSTQRPCDAGKSRAFYVQCTQSCQSCNNAPTYRPCAIDNYSPNNRQQPLYGQSMHESKHRVCPTEKASALFGTNTRSCQSCNKPPTYRSYPVEDYPQTVRQQPQCSQNMNKSRNCTIEAEKRTAFYVPNTQSCQSCNKVSTYKTCPVGNYPPTERQQPKCSQNMNKPTHWTSDTEKRSAFCVNNTQSCQSCNKTSTYRTSPVRNYPPIENQQPQYSQNMNKPTHWTSDTAKRSAFCVNNTQSCQSCNKTSTFRTSPVRNYPPIESQQPQYSQNMNKPTHWTSDTAKRGPFCIRTTQSCQSCNKASTYRTVPIDNYPPPQYPQSQCSKKLNDSNCKTCVRKQPKILYAEDTLTRKKPTCSTAFSRAPCQAQCQSYQNLNNTCKENYRPRCRSHSPDYHASEPTYVSNRSLERSAMERRQDQRTDNTINGLTPCSKKNSALKTFQNDERAPFIVTRATSTNSLMMIKTHGFHVKKAEEKKPEASEPVEEHTIRSRKTRNRTYTNNSDQASDKEEKTGAEVTESGAAATSAYDLDKENPEETKAQEKKMTETTNMTKKTSKSTKEGKSSEDKKGKLKTNCWPFARMGSGKSKPKRKKGGSETNTSNHHEYESANVARQPEPPPKPKRTFNIESLGPK